MRTLVGLVGALFLLLGVLYVWAGLVEANTVGEGDSASRRADRGGYSLARGVAGIAFGVGFMTSALLDAARPAVVGAVLFCGLMVVAFGFGLAEWWRNRPGPQESGGPGSGGEGRLL